MSEVNFRDEALLRPAFKETPFSLYVLSRADSLQNRTLGESLFDDVV